MAAYAVPQYATRYIASGAGAVAAQAGGTIAYALPSQVTMAQVSLPCIVKRCLVLNIKIMDNMSNTGCLLECPICIHVNGYCGCRLPCCCWCGCRKCSYSSLCRPLPTGNFGSNCCEYAQTILDLFWFIMCRDACGSVSGVIR